MPDSTQKFRKELQALLDRYKNKLPVPTIMGITQDTFHKTLSIRYHPELHQKAINYFMQSTGLNKPDLEGEWKSNGLKVPAELLEEPDPEFRKMLQGDSEL